jgi:hypothetical protein
LPLHNYNIFYFQNLIKQKNFQNILHLWKYVTRVKANSI